MFVPFAVGVRLFWWEYSKNYVWFLLEPFLVFIIFIFIFYLLLFVCRTRLVETGEKFVWKAFEKYMKSFLWKCFILLNGLFSLDSWFGFIFIKCIEITGKVNFQKNYEAFLHTNNDTNIHTYLSAIRAAPAFPIFPYFF